jgi:hypothetical protein
MPNVTGKFSWCVYCTSTWSERVKPYANTPLCIHHLSENLPKDDSQPQVVVFSEEPYHYYGHIRIRPRSIKLGCFGPTLTKVVAGTRHYIREDSTRLQSCYWEGMEIGGRLVCGGMAEKEAIRKLKALRRKFERPARRISIPCNCKRHTIHLLYANKWECLIVSECQMEKLTTIIKRHTKLAVRCVSCPNNKLAMCAWKDLRGVCCHGDNIYATAAEIKEVVQKVRCSLCNRTADEIEELESWLGVGTRWSVCGPACAEAFVNYRQFLQRQKQEQAECRRIRKQMDLEHREAVRSSKALLSKLKGALKKPEQERQEALRLLSQESQQLTSLPGS